MRFSASKKDRIEAEIPHLESALGTALRPVAPRSDFVNGLRSRLISEAKNRKPGLNSFHLFLLVMVGITTSILLILQGTRTIIGIISALNLLWIVGSQARRKNGQMSSKKAQRGIA